jgi:hypothetical protein
MATTGRDLRGWSAALAASGGAQTAALVGLPFRAPGALQVTLGNLAWAATFGTALAATAGTRRRVQGPRSAADLSVSLRVESAIAAAAAVTLWIPAAIDAPFLSVLVDSGLAQLTAGPAMAMTALSITLGVNAERVRRRAGLPLPGPAPWPDPDGPAPELLLGPGIVGVRW